jgi:hypothetical protein
MVGRYRDILSDQLIVKLVSLHTGLSLEAAAEDLKLPWRTGLRPLDKSWSLADFVLEP